MKTKLLYVVGAMLVSASISAQNLTDALRYSNHKVGGTARSAALGNAFGALGGDVSSLSINPAGVAVYRSGEFAFTPSFGKISVDGTYLGTTVNDSKYNLSLDNIGYILTIPTGADSESGLVSFNIGFGYNRLGNFSSNTVAEGANSNNSILGYFTDNMNRSYNSVYGHESEVLDPYYEKLAWETFLVNHDDKANEYFNDVSDAKYGQSQRVTSSKRGYVNEYVLSFGANFNHKFYLGGTVGIHDVYYKENKNLNEWDAKNNIPYFEDLNFGTYLKTTGEGFNVKLGAIYKPIDNLRLGLAVHTPTFYKLTDEYNSSMSASTHNNGKPVVPSKVGVYDYEIETPMKTIVSAAYVIGKLGLISIDYEIVDYSTAKLKNGSDGYDYFEQNKVISNAFKTVGNLHVGGEYRVSPNFSLRAGYENFPSAYKSTYSGQKSLNSDASYSTVAGGIGFKQGNVFVDATFKHIMDKEYQNIYSNSPEMVKYSSNQNNVIFTIGYKF